jgi:crossover junction endodeoxyribonuclease RuvC
MSIIIGIDPGLHATGYGVLEAAGNTIVHRLHGVIITKSTMATGDRLLQIYRQLTEVIKKVSPDEAGVESLFVVKNVKTAIPVAQARGVIILALAAQHIPVSEYTPLEVKRAVVGRGRAEKEQVQLMLKLILGLKKVPSPEHAADALAVAFCHSSHKVVTTRFSINSGEDHV